jgi:hypothetical protein
MGRAFDKSRVKIRGIGSWLKVVGQWVSGKEGGRRKDELRMMNGKRD